MKKMIIAGLALVASVSFAAGKSRLETASDFTKNREDLTKVAPKVKAEIEKVRKAANNELAGIIAGYSKGALSTAKAAELMKSTEVSTSMREMAEVMQRLSEATMTEKEKELAISANKVAFEYLEEYATYASTLPKGSLESKVALKLVTLSPNILLYREEQMAGYSSLKEEIMKQLDSKKSLLESIRAAAEIVAPKAGMKKGSEFLAKVEECLK